MTELEDAMQSLGRVAGEDNVPLVDTRGLDPTIGEAWRVKLSEVDDNLGFWVKTARKKAGSAATTATMHDYGAPPPDAPAEDDGIGEENRDEPNAVAAE